MEAEALTNLTLDDLVRHEAAHLRAAFERQYGVQLPRRPVGRAGANAGCLKRFLRRLRGRRSGRSSN